MLRDKITIKKRAPRSLTYKKVYDAAFQMFGYDRDKANAWWMSPMAEFNNLSPFQLVRDGKARKLMRFIEKCML